MQWTCMEIFITLYYLENKKNYICKLIQPQFFKDILEPWLFDSRDKEIIGMGGQFHWVSF